MQVTTPAAATLFMKSLVVETYARICACVADIEAMKALNDYRRRNDLAQAYTEESFNNVAVELRELAENLASHRLDGNVD